MSQGPSNISNVSAAGAYARADTLVSTLPIRAIDPTRQRFQVGDEVAADQAPAQAQTQADAAEADGQSSAQGKPSTGWGQAGFGLLGAFTAFIARMFAQSDTEAAAGAASVRSGLAAYARAAQTVSADSGGAEIIPPGFPKLSSGKTVDLSV